MKEWFKRLLAGIGVGAGSAVPGVSGGTIAVLFGIYEKFLWAISHIIKEFKRAFLYLLPILIGVVLGMVPMIIVMDHALEGFTFGIICIFAGYIVGSLPLLKDEVKDSSPKALEWIIFISCLLLAVGLGIASCFVSGSVREYFDNTPLWFYFVLIPVGILASTALAVPGISGGMILIILGFYRPLIDSTTDVAKECLSGDWSHFLNQFLILAIFGVGVIIGFFLTSKMMHFFLEKYHTRTFFAIIGFVIGGLIALYFNYEIYAYYLKWAAGEQGYLIKEIEIPLGIGLFIIFMILSYLLTRKSRKMKNEEKEETEKIEEK